MRHELGCRTASLDLEYSEPHMNFLKPVGFLTLGPNLFILHIGFVCGLKQCR